MLQLKVKRHLLYAAVVLVWITVPTILTTMGSYATDIVNGMCVPWGVYGGYVAEKIITSLLVSFTYLVPMMLTVFCYARIIFILLTRKVE